MEITIAETKIVQRNILTIDMKNVSMFNLDKENNLFVYSNMNSNDNGYGKIYSSQDGLFYDFYEDWDLYNTFIFGCFYSRKSSFISFFSNTSTPKQVEDYCKLDAALPNENKIIMSYQYNNRQIIIYNSEEVLAKNPEEAKQLGNIFIFKNENNTVSLLSPDPIWLESDPNLLPYAENEYVYIPRKDFSSTQNACTIYNLTTGQQDINCLFINKVESYIVYNGTVISAEQSDQFQYLRKGGTLGVTLRTVEATGKPVLLVGTGSPMYYQIPYINEVRY